MPTLCCNNLPVGRSVDSPFARIIFDGYYDGPTSGLAECGVCYAAYAFSLLAWDERQDVRIFKLMPLKSPVFACTIDLLTSRLHLGPPRWPILGTWSKRMSPAELSEVSDEIETIFASAGDPVYVVATEDLSKKIISAGSLSSEEIARARSTDLETAEIFNADWTFWSARLGLASTEG